MKTILILFILVLKIFCTVLPLLLAVAYFTLAERKMMGGIQRRKGPDIVGLAGILQPIADGLKLFAKETILPSSADLDLFLFAPALSFILSLVGWCVVPYGLGAVICDLNLGVLYLLAISSLSVYGILLAGWSSNSKYAYLGALRSAAQMISYEISIGFIILNVMVVAGSANLSGIVLAQKNVWFILPLLPVFIVFCVSMLAETNRHPFDLPEAEAELVSGYNVEYSGMTFALFFLGEYANMLLMSAFCTTLFLGGWLPLTKVAFFKYLPHTVWFSFKVILGAIFFILTRATLPRYRYDQLMHLGWKCFLPFSIGYLLFTSSILISFNWLPN